MTVRSRHRASDTEPRGERRRQGQHCVNAWSIRHSDARARRFEADDTAGANLVCAVIDFGGSVGNPLVLGLPDPFLAPLSEMPGMESVIALLFVEAFAARGGRQPIIDRLAETCFLLLLRHL